MKFFIYQRGKQSGPFTQEDVRLQLLSGDLKSSYLAWHSRLAEWTPISRLASVDLLDDELSEPPDPKASSYYDALREEKASRRRTRRSADEASQPRSPRSRAQSTPRSAAPPEEPAAPRRSGSDREHRVRLSRKREQPSEEPSVGLWGQIKAFFEN